MAAVIHALWERNDSGLMILPASIPIDHVAEQSELVRYLDPGWSAATAFLATCGTANREGPLTD